MKQKGLHENSSAEVFKIYSEKSLDFETEANMFKCSNQMYISIQFTCDGLNDCPGNEPADEKNCKCNHTNDFSSNCKYFQSIKGRKACSLFYLKTADGHCHLYNYVINSIDRHDTCIEEHQVLQNNLHYSPEHFTHKQFGCNKNVNISLLLVNDLVSDCGPETNEEYILKSIATGNRSYCINRNQIPCRKGHTICFDISEICTYQLNHLKHLIACRTGEHLENCRKVECNMMFKCPGYYCIPWSYVCDGIWDCPQGSDETIDSTCTQSRQYINFYKCRHASRCVHVDDVCNKKIEYPLGDDEYFCRLNNVT